MGFLKPPKPAPKSQEELAAESRAQKSLDDETAQNEKRLKALARGKLGTQSLLVSNATASGGGSKGSKGTMMGGGSSGSSTGAGNYNNLLRGIGR